MTHEVEPESRSIQRAIDGDEIALQVILARSRAQLRAYVSNRIPEHLARVLDAEDIVQEAHIAVFRSVCTVKSNRPEAFHRWVKTIALNRLRNAIRDRQAAKRGGGRVGLGPRNKTIDDSTVELFDMLSGPGRTPSRSVARHEAIEAVQGAMSDLPEQYRQAMRLVHLEGCSFKEAALKMGRSERAVQGLCRRGIKRLEKRLGRASAFLSSTG
jgi:RNA polymerase sigma-70 factor (ECF subfamily)